MNRSSSRQSMFLMEIIIAILFFSLVSAVCLRIFTGARQMSQDTGNLHRAVNQAQNAAELLTYGKTRGGGRHPSKRRSKIPEKPERNISPGSFFWSTPTPTSPPPVRCWFTMTGTGRRVRRRAACSA